jgi:hypothetical protein
MRYKLLFISVLISLNPLKAQWSVQMNELYDHVADTSGIELSFGNWEQKTLSNTSIEHWHGQKPVSIIGNVYAFNETTQDLINLRFHRRKWQFGLATTNYNFNSRELSPTIFNALYLDENTGSGSYSFTAFSSLKHSLTIGRSLWGVIDLTAIINGHQLNSLSHLDYSGSLTQSITELSADFNGSYYSYNSDFTDTSRGIANLPQAITATDSGHYSVYRYAPLHPTFGFYMKINLGKRIAVTAFGNHLGGSSDVTAIKQDNAYKLSLNSAVIETIDLLNTSINPIISPTGNYSYQETRGNLRDTVFSAPLQPQVLGSSLSFFITPDLELNLSTSQTNYSSFVNNRHSFLLKKYFETNYLLAGILVENLNSNQSFYNLVLGARYEVAPRLSIRFYSNTATNFIYLNQTMAPKGISRMQFTIGAEITLP